jgi:hypothetical protein
MSGKKTFSINVVSSKAFSFIMNSFDYAVTFFFNVKQKFNISFVPTMQIRSTSDIILKKIKMAISRVNFIVKETSSVSIKRIKISIIVKEIGKVIFPITLRKIGISAIARLNQKVSTPVGLKKIKFVFTGVYGTFYRLSVYDPQTLGTLDTKTLGEMDFTVSP